MSDAKDSTGPRRSQRDRKQASHFVSAQSQSSKRKRSEDEDESGLSDPDVPDAVGEEADVEEDYTASRPKPKAKQPGNGVASEDAAPRRRGRPPGKKTRIANSATGIVTKSRKSRANKGGISFNAEQVAKETKIANDNPLFNAIMNPSAALQSVVEDYLESLTQTPAAAQAELINSVLRACGCNHSFDEDEAVDYDGIVDSLDNLTEVLKQDDTPVYPLTSKLPAFKPFRMSLSEFLLRLISAAAAMGHIYNTDLMMTLQAWVVAMSSSQLRSFRHTATVVALEIETALCEVAANVEKEAEVVSRQKEGERKRKKGRGESSTAREKELNGKAAEIRERRTKLAEFLKEFIDGVFVHRYRDFDPNIRTECVRAMGLWFSKYPAHFLDSTYLRYVGWVLSDSNTHVRLEAVKALALAYAQTEFIGIGALQHFTERFKPRLVEMAVGDTELSVRIAVVHVLQAIDGHGLLEDEQREKLCLLVFDEEPRMRRAVSGFVKGVWQEGLEERLVGKKPDAKDKKRAGIKAFATLLVQWGKALDMVKDLQEDDDDAEQDGEQSEDSRRGRRKEVISVVGPEQKGRIALAVEALWDEITPVSDWETLLELLQLDHSTPEESQSSQSRANRKHRQANTSTTVNEVWRLEEVEEGILLEVLAAALRKAKTVAAAGKKGEDETVSSDITRALIKALPHLFVKYQTDAGRMSDILQLPQFMNLEMYLEMRMMTAYASLWDDVMKQFTSHSSAIVLSNAVATIRCMMDATSLSNMNSTKVLELEEQLSSSLRDLVKGRDELEIVSFSEDEILALSSVCTRLATLAGTRDMTSWIEEDEGGKQSSAWDIIMALVERGKLGYREEQTLIDQALHSLTLYIIWKARGLTSASDPSPEELSYRTTLKQHRDVLLERLLEFVVGTQSNTTDGVRRAAFQNLMNLHILFCPAQSIAPDGSILPTAALALTLDDETQHRLATFVQGEIERYSEELVDNDPADQEDDGLDSEQYRSEDEAHQTFTRNEKAMRRPHALRGKHKPVGRTRLEREYLFMGVVATFLRAIRAGAIHFRHCATLLAHYGRLGTSFDICSKLIVEILREEGMYKGNGDTVVAVVTQALRESFLMYLDGITRSEEHSVSLAKLLATCCVIRGAQLSVVKRLESQFVVNIHTNLISWACKRIASYVGSNNKTGRTKCIMFFKTLVPLVNSADVRDSLKITAHLDQALAECKIEVPVAAKAWDAYRSYEKRLQTYKEKGGGPGVKPKRAKGRAKNDVITDDEDQGVDDTEPPLPKVKPKARPVRYRAQTAEVETAEDSEHRSPSLSVTPRTPQPVDNAVNHSVTPVQRSRISATSPLISTPSPSGRRSLSLSEPPSTPEIGESPISMSSRKRPHSPGDSAHESPPEDNDKEPSADRAGSQDSQIHIRRKRVRH